MRKTFRSAWFAILLALAPAALAEYIPGRYIVELTSTPVVEQLATTAAIGSLQTSHTYALRAGIHAEQQRVRRQLELRSATVLDSVDTVANALFVAMPAETAAQLALLPGIKRVIPVRRVDLLLDRAVLLHKVADAWNQVGTDRAGAGVKIAIVDTGMEASHAAFQDSSLVIPQSFPRVNFAADTASTNNKIIVARSYVNLLPHRDADASAQDRVGHGTAVATVAAGVRNAGPLATITGVAPKAFLGNYKVFGTPGVNDYSSDDAIIKAIDDAVADGMDIISLSVGTALAPRLADDVEVQAIERATRAGVIVVVAAGNAGPDPNTISSPASAPSAIAVGATSNDRTFAASVEVAGVPPFVGILGDGPAPASPVTAAIADVTALDGNGLACAALPANGLKNEIALILRGACTFETKLNNALQAGAVGAVVYARAESPDAISMAVGTATLPAEMVANSDGLVIQQRIGAASPLTATLRFTLGSVPVPPDRITDFSAAGPNVDAGIKPDLTAVGSDMYVATQSFDPNGDMYDAGGYILVDGTSFSTPLVAGAAALLKGARPGLTVDQYRSLLINSAASVQSHNGQDAAIQQGGAGLLDASAALNLTAAVAPVSLSFGSGGGAISRTQTLHITNLGSANDVFSLSAVPRGNTGPVLNSTTVELAGGASADVPIAWNAAGLTAGNYDGFVIVRSTANGGRAAIPYWYGVTSGIPAHITVLDSIASARRGALKTDAMLLRITDVAGVALPAAPQVIVVSGGGSVVRVVSHDGDVPGMFGVDVTLGRTAGPNVFRITAGDVSIDVTIDGT